MATKDNAHSEPQRIEAHKEAMRIEAHEEAKRIEAPTEADLKEDVPAVTADVDETPRYVQYGAAILLGLAFGVGCYIWYDTDVPSTGLTADNIKIAPTEEYFTHTGTYDRPSAEGITPDPFISPFEPTLEVAEVTATAAVPVATAQAGTAQQTAAADAAQVAVEPVKVVYLFAYDSSAVPENADLTAIAKQAQRRGMTLDVKAYTDEHGRPAYNKRLSERRARAIGDYLVAHGVPAAKVVVHGMGPTHAYANDAQDRRAEVVIVK